MMDIVKLKKMTAIFIIACIVIISAFDVWVYGAGGTEATISWTIYTWGMQHPMVPFAVGVLCGHFFWQMKNVKICHKCGEVQK